jgi:hypothetical protein
MLNEESFELKLRNRTPIKNRNGGTHQKSKTKTELRGSVVKCTTTIIPQKVESTDMALEVRATRSNVRV